MVTSLGEALRVVFDHGGDLADAYSVSFEFHADFDVAEEVVQVVVFEVVGPLAEEFFEVFE